jgi:hypothetical protein
MKSKEVKTGCNTAESSKESYGSRKAALPVMMTFTQFVSDCKKCAVTFSGHDGIIRM